MPSEKRVLAVRLSDAEFAQLEAIANEESRSLANLAEVFIRKGMKDFERLGGFPVRPDAGPVTHVRGNPRKPK